MTPAADLPTTPRWVELAAVPCALFLDIDGTLLEFESHPGLVRAPTELIDLLRSVSDALGGALALISGRSLTDIDRVFAPWQPYAAGVHGAEVRGSLGTRRHQADDALLGVLRARASTALKTPGVWVEDKGHGFAVHYRGAPDAETAVRSLALELAAASDGTLEVQPGAYVQELRPAAYDKGLAVAELMEHPPFTNRMPVVVGDDRTDEFAFAAANARGGVSVLVGPRTDTVAQYRITDPAAVRGWLSEIFQEVP